MKEWINMLPTITAPGKTYDTIEFSYYFHLMIPKNLS